MTKLLVPNMRCGTTMIGKDSTTTTTTTTTTASHYWQQQQQGRRRREEEEGVGSSFPQKRNFSTNPTTTTESPQTKTTTPEVLLLTGDEYCVSSNGMARTLYQLLLQDDENDDNHDKNKNHLCVEEIYDMMTSRKRFVLRQRQRQQPQRQQETPPHENIVSMGIPLRHYFTKPIEIQEIPHSSGSMLLGGAGTGATTWDSSLVMLLLIASSQITLGNNILELGSGVGLGGILASDYLKHNDDDHHHWTLTDVNAQCLQQCHDNLQRQQHDNNNNNNVTIAKLDWYDFLKQEERNNNDNIIIPPLLFEGQCHEHYYDTILANDCAYRSQDIPAYNYDTILANDCAYRSQDIPALLQTMKQLLLLSERQHTTTQTQKQAHKRRIHIVGPDNRSGLQELYDALQDEGIYDITTQTVHLQRYRLIANNNSNNAGNDSSHEHNNTNTHHTHDDDDRDEKKDDHGMGHRHYSHHHHDTGTRDDTIMDTSSSSSSSCPYATKYTSRFLHICCTLRPTATVSSSSSTTTRATSPTTTSLADID